MQSVSRLVWPPPRLSPQASQEARRRESPAKARHRKARQAVPTRRSDSTRKNQRSAYPSGTTASGWPIVDDVSDPRLARGETALEIKGSSLRLQGRLACFFDYWLVDYYCIAARLLLLLGVIVYISLLAFPVSHLCSPFLLGKLFLLLYQRQQDDTSTRAETWEIDTTANEPDTDLSAAKDSASN